MVASAKNVAGEEKRTAFGPNFGLKSSLLQESNKLIPLCAFTHSYHL
jgi:hypothetical protein